MMLFEEFFKKKKIDLGSLQQGEPGLFLEFKDHYEQMGEKSFDHTKKYWFNKLRHQFPLAPEVKAERLRPENQIAEQTVADTLTEPSTRDEAPKLGFKPKFKTATPATEKTARAEADQPVTEGNEFAATDYPANKPPKVGFTPRFKAGVTASKPANESNPEAEAAKPDETTENNAIETPATEQPAPAKVGFKPRFKAGVTNRPAEDTPKEAAENAPDAVSQTDETVAKAAPAKMGFKPRFKAGVTTSKPAEDTNAAEADKIPLAKTETTDESPATAEQPAPAKMGFKPRFKAGVTNKPAAQEEPAPVLPVENTEPPVAESSEEQAAPAKLGFKAGDTTSEPVSPNPAVEPVSEITPTETKAVEENATNEASAQQPPAANEEVPKPAYKPRFTPGMIKRKPPTTEE